MSDSDIFHGVRVLDLTRVMSGPFCTSMLSDLGAEVIKIEIPDRGDEGRSFGPYKDQDSTYFMLLNRNKYSVTLDLKAPEGQQILRDMIAQCDVLVENFRPGVMKKLGLDYETVRHINPRLVYASISGFGQEGPMKNLPAFDLVIQAMSGLMSLTGQKNGSPTAVGESMADVCAGIFAAWGIAAALYAREKTGAGKHVDIAMLDSMVSMQLTGLSRQLFFNDTPKPVGNRHPVTYPVDSFAAADGALVLVCFSQDLFIRLAQLIGHPEIATDERFATNQARNQHEDELRTIIEAWTSTLKLDDAVDQLIKTGIPAAPIWNLEQVMSSPHAHYRNLSIAGHHGRQGDIPLVPQPVKFSGMAPQTTGFSPMLGEHTHQILGQILGLQENEINQLRDKKII
ncbi:CaiB/BaiF CoA-transferase family protein [Ochrobactrum vermis]|uniref:CaiB/BaiF CoA-transferase family protein n=1 Tax=Ochrobactrum vermis TaxID=1827297 RepID=A0ABU8PLD5_9HYPH|nr:CaiB/BaiF CoA-transferase family protein [Ochrobactrum vermis]PQZ24443.1 CoA transferase [Ochrobactrum vermis]